MLRYIVILPCSVGHPLAAEILLFGSADNALMIGSGGSSSGNARLLERFDRSDCLVIMEMIDGGYLFFSVLSRG